MSGKIVYQLVKEYEHFKLYDVYLSTTLNGKTQEKFLYKTTTHKVSPKLGNHSMKWVKEN